MGAVSGSAGLVSHDFYEGTFSGLSPDPEWQELDALTDCTLSFDDTGGVAPFYCQLSIPASAHTVEGPFNGHAVVQPVTTGVDWSVEIEVINETVAVGEVCGIVAFNADKTQWVTFDFYHGGGGVAMEFMTYNGSTAAFPWSGAAFTGPTYPIGLRLGYVDATDSWVFDKQENGGGWSSPHADSVFALTPAFVGFFVANYNTVASTRQFDWFFESGNPVTPQDTFSSTVSTGAAGIESDDFQSGGSLDGIWTVTQGSSPSNDCTVSLVGQGTSNAQCTILVPQSGNEHDFWSTNNSCRVTQTCNAASDFEVTVKMEGSAPSAQYQARGICVYDDTNGSALRIDNYYGGGAFNIFAAFIDFGVNGSTQNDSAISSVDTLWLRYKWTQSTEAHQWFYSTNGTDFTAYGGNDNASIASGPGAGYVVTPERVGFFAGNSGNPAAYTAVFDYFFESSAPISPEDGVGGPAPRRVMVR